MGIIVIGTGQFKLADELGGVVSLQRRDLGGRSRWGECVVKEVGNGILTSGSGNHLRELIISISAIDHGTLVEEVDKTRSRSYLSCQMDTRVASLVVNAIRDDHGVLQIQVDVRVAVEKVEEQHIIVQNALVKESLLQLVCNTHIRSVKNQLRHCIHRALSHDGERESIAIVLCLRRTEGSNVCLGVHIRDLVTVQEGFHHFITALHTSDVEGVSSSLCVIKCLQNNVIRVVGISAVLQEILDNRMIVLVGRVTECIASLLRTSETTTESTLFFKRTFALFSTKSFTISR